MEAGSVPAHPFPGDWGGVEQPVRWPGRVTVANRRRGQGMSMGELYQLWLRRLTQLLEGGGGSDDATHSPPNESATAILGDNFPRHIFLFGKLHNNSCLCLFVMRCCVGACHLSTHTTRKLSPAHSFLLAEDFSDGPPKRGLAGRACSRCLCWVEPKLGLQPPPPQGLQKP